MLVIVGPTGVGKTAVALKLAKILKGEIVSIDSRQIYKFLDIGTAKPTKEERKEVPQHLIDIINPDEEFSVADFKKEAEKKIQALKKRKILPVLVGGSPLYIKAVIDGLFIGPGKKENLRKELKEEADKFGNEYLYQKLKKVDPESANKLHPNNLRRIIRALEIFTLTGKPISDHQKKTNSAFKGQKIVIIGLQKEREVLYKRINERVDEMIGKGLIEEVKRLLRRGYQESLNSLQGLGYKEIIGYLKERYNREEAIRLLKRNTRRFAKRQIAWFKKDKRIIWVEMKGDDLEKTVQEIKKIFMNNREGAY